MTIKGILFDLDGTLIDTTDLIIQSFDHTIKTHFNRPAERDVVIRYFGRPLRDAMTYFSPGHEEELMATYRLYNIANHDRLTKSYPTVTDTIKTLKNDGYKLGVVTSKFSDTARKGLRLFDLEQYFDSVIGVDRCTHYKPHPEPVAVGASSLDLTPDECMMIGDSPADLQSATAAGAQCAAVKWTLVPWSEMESAKPTFVLEQMSDLVPILKQHSES